MTAFYYGLTVLIWGTTWIAIKNQIGIVPIEASIAYRFALAGTVLLLVLLMTRRLHPIALRHHPLIALQAACLYSCNFICLYMAMFHVPSGVVSVVSSAVAIFNIMNAFILGGRRPERRVLTGAVMGVAGIVCLSWDSVTGATFAYETIKGVAVALLGAWFFSIGNLVSARNQEHGLPIASVNAWAMLYGAAIVSLFAVARGVPFTFDPSPVYVASLIHLAMFGSIIAFIAYLTVVGRLGPEKAGYMTVLCPAVAVLISMLFENYRLTPLAGVGLAAVLVGNVLVLMKGPKASAMAASLEQS